MSATYAAFAESEHRERLARARAILAHNGIECCVSVAPEHLYYFAGYDFWVSVNAPQALVFMAGGGEPTWIVRDVDLALPRETSWVADVRSYHLFSDDVGALIASVAGEKGFRGGKVAVETQSYALPLALGQALSRALAPAAIVDATEMLGAARLIKSPAEMRYLREAARFARIGLDAARKTLKPGISEIALAAAVEGAMRGAGSDYWSIPTELASGPRTAGGHATPRERVIELGDLVHLEFAGVARRYHATAVHTIAAGPPSRRAREIYALARPLSPPASRRFVPASASTRWRRPRSSPCARRHGGRGADALRLRDRDRLSADLAEPADQRLRPGVPRHGLRPPR